MKLRVGKCLALEAESKSNDIDACEDCLLKVDRILLNALEVSQKSAKEAPALEVEISFIRGKKELLFKSKCWPTIFSHGRKRSSEFILKI